MILSGIHEYYEPEELVGKTAIAIVNLPPRKMMGIDSEGMLISAVHEEDGHEGLNLLMVNDRIPAGCLLYTSIGNIAQQLYNTVDSIVIGKYVGDNALAAVGSASPILNLLLPRSASCERCRSRQLSHTRKEACGLY